MFSDTEKYYLYLNLTNIFNFVINKYEDPNKLQEYILYLYDEITRIEEYYQDKYIDINTNKIDFYTSWIFYQLEKREKIPVKTKTMYGRIKEYCTKSFIYLSKRHYLDLYRFLYAIREMLDECENKLRTALNILIEIEREIKEVICKATQRVLSR